MSTASGDSGGDEPGSGRAAVRTATGREPAERAVQESGRVGDGEHGAGNDEAQGEGSERRGGVEQPGDVCFFRDEAVQQWYACHRRGAHRGDRERNGPPPREAVELPQVACTELVVDHADHQEQWCFEQGVGEQGGGAAEGRVDRAETEHDHEEAELAHRPVGEEQLEIELSQGPVPTPEHRHPAETDDEGPPRIDIGEGWSEHGDEVDARFHHRGGVQVRTDRCGCGHGAGEPGVQGHLGRLREGAGEDQDERHRHQAIGWRIGHDLVQREGPGFEADQDETAQEGETTGSSDHECLGRCVASGSFVVGESDEQEGADRGELPEDEDQDEVVGQDETEHRAGEEGQQASEATELGHLAEVREAVEVDQHADARDQRNHQQGQTIESERELETELGDPGPLLADDTPIEHRRGLGERPEDRCRRGDGSDHQRGAAETPPDQRGERSEHAVGENEPEHQRSTRPFRRSRKR